MRTDVVVIGSGAGGGPMALTLAQAGFDVLVLEKGREHAREEYEPDELGVLHRSFLVPSIEDDPHTVVTRKTTQPLRTQMGWIASCVGGGTVHMGGYLYRFHPDDFRMRSRFGEYEEIVDWPVSYEELEPYYLRAEWEVGVCGRGGVTPHEGSRSADYPMPPLENHPLAEHLAEACRRRGFSPFPTPRSINSQPYQGRPSCAYCYNCSGYGCRTGAKGSVQEALLPRAVATGRCTVRPESMVQEILVGRDGRATGCVFVDADGNENEVEAKVVCLSASAIESARLLLMSKSARFPDGLANGSGRVGRHLQFHGASFGNGRFYRRRNPGLPLGNEEPFLEVSVMDHYFLADGVSDLPKGGIIRYGLPGPAPLATALGIFARSDGPLWGHDLMERLHHRMREAVTVYFEVFHDFLPNERTWVELDSEVTDRWGLPVARIHLDLPEHHDRAGRWLVERGLEVLGDMGAVDLQQVGAGSTNTSLVHGTCRMGSDPSTSVLNSWCRAHDVPNLYVVDGSFMPTSGGAAPTLTILAMSFRVAEHVAQQLTAGVLG